MKKKRIILTALAGAMAFTSGVIASKLANNFKLNYAELNSYSFQLASGTNPITAQEISSG